MFLYDISLQLFKEKCTFVRHKINKITKMQLRRIYINDEMIAS
jgi:hypothetical protein